MERHSFEFALEQNLSEEEGWARAVAEVEHIVGSDEPLVAAREEAVAPARRRRSLARPLGLSLFVVSGAAVALAFLPAPQPGPDGGQVWRSARR